MTGTGWHCHWSKKCYKSWECYKQGQTLDHSFHVSGNEYEHWYSAHNCAGSWEITQGVFPVGATSAERETIKEHSMAVCGTKFVVVLYWWWVISVVGCGLQWDVSPTILDPQENQQACHGNYLFYRTWRNSDHKYILVKLYWVCSLTLRGPV
jgi:hypothetical protein